jgi:uncharacterized protein GlcG (DUF336 family)
MENSAQPRTHSHGGHVKRPVEILRDVDQWHGLLGGDNAYALDISIGKATTAASFRRPSKALEDSMAPGGSALRILGVRSATPLQGGVPIVVDGKIIGAIGVSGVMASQDEQVAMAGAAALATK